MDRDCGSLLDLNELRQRLRLGAPVFERDDTIRVDQIIGTVGRAGDFDGCFRPLRQHIERRIANILDAKPTVAHEAIEVMRVDRAYFVVDGHKRVSIAKSTGMEFIDAQVSHLASAYELGPGVDEEAIDRTAREAQFREESGLLEAVPRARFAVGDLNGYAELLEAVRAYGYQTSRELGRLMAPPEAAGCWYECVYLPTVRAAHQARISDLIDSCTDADMFLALHRQSRALFGRECAAAEKAAERLIEEERSRVAGGVSAVERLLRRARRRRQPAPALLELADPIAD
jgi:hypothetical protein